MPFIIFICSRLFSLWSVANSKLIMEKRRRNHWSSDWMSVFFGTQATSSSTVHSMPHIAHIQYLTHNKQSIKLQIHGFWMNVWFTMCNNLDSFRLFFYKIECAIFLPLNLTFLGSQKKDWQLSFRKKNEPEWKWGISDLRWIEGNLCHVPHSHAKIYYRNGLLFFFSSLFYSHIIKKEMNVKEKTGTRITLEIGI